MIRGDLDFSKVTFKVNASGSWANLVTCDADHIDEMKKACEKIASAGWGRPRFKYVDAAGGTCEVLAKGVWHAPTPRGR